MIFQTLSQELGDFADIIHPNLGSGGSILSKDTKESEEASLNFIETLSEIYKKTNSLIKPVVYVLNTESSKARTSSSMGGAHWIAMVIIPANYSVSEFIKDSSMYVHDNTACP